MGTKTFVVTAKLVDEETQTQRNLVTHESNVLTPLDVCDLQDLLMTGFIDPLRQKARALAEAKETQPA